VAGPAAIQQNQSKINFMA